MVQWLKRLLRSRRAAGSRLDCSREFPRVFAVWHPFTQSEYFVGRIGNMVRLSQCANRLQEMYDNDNDNVYLI